MPQKNLKPKRVRHREPKPQDFSPEPDVDEEQPRGRKRRAVDESILAKAQKYMTTIPDQQLDPQVNQEINFELPKRKKPRKGKQKNKLDVADHQPQPTNSNKRKSSMLAHANDNDDDEDESPAKKSKKNKKKKKKSKNKAQAATTPDKNSIKEKQHASECLHFLRTWESNRSEWKFNKLKQVWLLKNILNAGQINDQDFEILLAYMGSVQGHARGVTLKEMSIFMQAYEGKYLGANLDKGQKATDEVTRQYNRAREIVQMLGDEAE